MCYLFLVALLWIVGAIVTFNLLDNKVKGTFNRVWFSCFWPCLVVLYPIHYLYNKYK
jgi:hypothetical protein